MANVGNAGCTGPWTDAAYLSRDQYFSADDILLGTLAHSGDLAPGERYTQTMTVALLPASPVSTASWFALSSRTRLPSRSPGTTL